MSQGGPKFKEEYDQPSIKGFCDTPKEQRIKKGGHISRSRSVKRKTPPTTSKQRDSKRPTTEHSNTMEPQSVPEGLKQTAKEDTNSKKLDQPMLDALAELLQPIKDDIKDLLNTQNELKEGLVECKRLREENSKLQYRIVKVEQENKNLIKRVANLEDRILESSVIIQGLQESAWETEAVRQEKVFIAISETIVGSTLEDRLETARSMVIKGTKRIGTYNAMKTRPISVEFLYKGDAEYILRNRKYLSEGIYVDREYCKSTEECRRILRPFLQAARKLPQYHKKCKLEGDILVLNGIKYTKDCLHRLPPELSGFNISSKHGESVFGYFGNMNPFSNFHPAMFMHEGNVFNCSEQFIQFSKAKYFNAEEVGNRILRADNALECKRLSREIKNYDHAKWNNIAKELCEPGITAKFLQNPILQKLLHETRGKTIVECCYDQIWGTGVPLKDDRCLEPRFWKSQGIMGEILENIRSKLLSTSSSIQRIQRSTVIEGTQPVSTIQVPSEGTPSASGVSNMVITQ